MELLPGRSISPGQKVRVYVNLHKQGMFSIVDMKSGLVCGYAKNCSLKEVTFYVSERGKQAVRQKKNRLVHAWVRGIFVDADIHEVAEYAAYTYNPYLHEGFTNSKGCTIETAAFAYLSSKKVYVKKEGNLKS